MRRRVIHRWLLNFSNVVYAAFCGGAVAGAPGAVPAGVDDPQRAWQHWALNCQGCHRTDGSGSPQTAPSLAGMVARFTNVPGGREYLARVPGVATAPLSDSDLAQLLNWTLWRFDATHLSPDFKAYSAQEIGVLRARPLRTEAAHERARLIVKLNHSHK